MKNIFTQLLLLLMITPLLADQHEDVSDRGTITSIIENAGSISGYVYDSGGSAIPEARVSLVNGAGLSTITNSLGFYRIYNVKAGYGYEVQAEKAGYLPQTIASVLVQENTVTENIIFNLQTGHSPDGPFTVTEPVFDPNPEFSEIGVGGTAVRYYLIKDASSGEVVPSMPLYLAELPDSAFYSNSEGIAAVKIPASLIGAAGAINYYTVQKAGNYTLPSADQLVFSVQVVEREYTKAWKSSIFGEIGVSWIDIEFNRAAKVGISIIDDGESLEYDSLTVMRQARAAAGVSYGVSAPLNVNMGAVNAGAKARVGVNIGAITEDHYRFPYYGYDSYQAVAQYILFADGNYKTIDETLIKYLAICQDWFTDDESIQESYRGDYKGVNIKAFAEANASMGIDGLNKNKKLFGMEAGVSAEVSTLFQMQSFRRQNTNNMVLSTTGTMEGNLNFDFPFPAKFSNHTLGLGANIGGTLGGELGISFKNGEWNQNWFKFLRGYEGGFNVSFVGGKGTLGAEREFESTYYFPSDNIRTIMEDISDNVSNLREMRTESKGFSLSNTSYGNILYGTLESLSEQQKENPSLFKSFYTKEQTDKFPLFEFEVKCEVSDGEKTLSGKVGGGFTFAEMYNWESEKGYFYNWDHYPSELYTKPAKVDLTYQNKVQEIYDNTPWYLKALLATVKFFTFTKSKMNADYEFIIGDNNSKVSLSDNSLTLDGDSLACFNWNWWGNSSAKRKQSLSTRSQKIFSDNKKRAQENQKLEYGIGGFYQFEPYNLALNDTSSVLTIVYSDTEIVGFAEKELAVYKKDKKHNRWVFLGGVVDDVNNTVSVNIDSLGLFTLAPKSPFGDIMLKSSVDSLPADGYSQAAISSENLYYNDGSLISDGALYTVALDKGMILTADEDRTINGIQVSAKSGKISFDVQSDTLSLPATVKVQSLSGNSAGTISLVYTDDTAPSAPQLNTIEVKKGKIYLTWDKVAEPDIAGYKIFFDTDASGAPYNGTASIDGRPSPVDVGKILEAELNGLTPDTTYYIAVTSYDLAGNESIYSNELTIITSIENGDEIKVPEKFYLQQNYPNPFNPLTTIEYELPKATVVKVVIYNSIGQKINTLVDENKLAGKYRAIWNGRNTAGHQVASGVYFYKIQAGSFIKIKKMVLVR